MKQDALKNREIKLGVWVYDFGKNVTGFIRINAKCYPYSIIIYWYRVWINEDGSIDMDVPVHILRKISIGMRVEQYNCVVPANTETEFALYYGSTRVLESGEYVF